MMLDALFNCSRKQCSMQHLKGSIIPLESTNRRAKLLMKLIPSGLILIMLTSHHITSTNRQAEMAGTEAKKYPWPERKVVGLNNNVDDTLAVCHWWHEEGKQCIHHGAAT